jgi:hypothetical protein
MPKGTVVEVKQPGTEGWWKVTVLGEPTRSGWIQSNKLSD